MGCWNGTCGLTQLPIRHGEKVRLYIIEPNRCSDGVESGHGHSYPTDLYSVVTLPIKGEYDDYGGLEKITKDSNVKAILNYFNEKIKTCDVKGDNGKPITKFKNIDDLVNYIQQGHSSYRMFMVLENAYQAAIKATKSEILKSPRGNELLKGVKYTVKLNETLSKKNGLLKVTKKLIKNEQMYDLTLLSIKMNIDRCFRDMLDSTYLLDFLLNEPSKDIITDLEEHHIMSSFMSRTRKTWAPQAGSQNLEYNIHRAMAETIIAHIESVKKQYTKECGGSKISKEDLKFIEDQY